MDIMNDKTEVLSIMFFGQSGLRSQFLYQQIVLSRLVLEKISLPNILYG